MRKLLIPAAIAASLMAGAALAQPPAAAPAAPAAASTEIPAKAGKMSVEKTPINDIIKVPAAKAALEKTLPEIAQFYDQIGTMSLREVEPLSQGALDNDKLKALQAEFDKI